MAAISPAGSPDPVALETVDSTVLELEAEPSSEVVLSPPRSAVRLVGVSVATSIVGVSVAMRVVGVSVLMGSGSNCCGHVSCYGHCGCMCQLLLVLWVCQFLWAVWV